MYARVISLLVREGKLDELVTLLHEDIIPEARRQPGFQRVMLLTDARTGTCILISYWASEEEMVASRESGYYNAQIEKLRPLTLGYPVAHHYQVRLQE
jgi:quinol monooxygenase YgiN